MVATRIDSDEKLQVDAIPRSHIAPDKDTRATEGRCIIDSLSLTPTIIGFVNCSNQGTRCGCAWIAYAGHSMVRNGSCGLPVDWDINSCQLLVILSLLPDLLPLTLPICGLYLRTARMRLWPYETCRTLKQPVAYDMLSPLCCNASLMLCSDGFLYMLGFSGMKSLIAWLRRPVTWPLSQDGAHTYTLDLVATHGFVNAVLRSGESAMWLKDIATTRVHYGTFDTSIRCRDWIYLRLFASVQALGWLDTMTVLTRTTDTIGRFAITIWP